MSFHNFASRQQARPAVALGRLAAAPIQPPISIPTSNQRIFINEVGHSKHFKDPAEPHSNQKTGRKQRRKRIDRLCDYCDEYLNSRNYTDHLRRVHTHRSGKMLCGGDNGCKAAWLSTPQHLAQHKDNYCPVRPGRGEEARPWDTEKKRFLCKGGNKPHPEPTSADHRKTNDPGVGDESLSTSRSPSWHNRPSDVDWSVLRDLTEAQPENLDNSYPGQPQEYFHDSVPANLDLSTLARNDGNEPGYHITELEHPLESFHHEWFNQGNHALHQPLSFPTSGYLNVSQQPPLDLDSVGPDTPYPPLHHARDLTLPYSTFDQERILSSSRIAQPQPFSVYYPQSRPNPQQQLLHQLFGNPILHSSLPSTNQAPPPAFDFNQFPPHCSHSLVKHRLTRRQAFRDGQDLAS